MMQLRSSPASPFGRKIKLAAAMLGLEDRVESVPTDTNDPSDSIRRQNPLGKIPALVLEDGAVLFDSRVILEYLDFLAGGGIIIPHPSVERFHVLTQATLCDGILDACILRVYEGRFRDPAKHEQKWLTYQAEKVARALTALEGDLPKGPRNVAHIGLACVLGYIDLRFEGAWRTTHSKFVAWLDAFAVDVPAFEATRFTPPQS